MFGTGAWPCASTGHRGFICIFENWVGWQAKCPRESGEIVRARLAIQLVTIALAAALPGFAQEQAPERWNLQGTLGADLSSTTNTPLFAPSNSNLASGYSTVAGDFGLVLGGFLKDPKFVPFTIDFSGEHGSNAVALGGFRDTVYDFGFSASFLPDRPFPLHIFYRKSEYGANGTGFGETSDTSSFGLTWELRVPRLPHVDVHYLRQANEVQLPTSLTNSNFHLNQLGIDANDRWKGWNWNAGFDDFSTTNNAVAALTLASPFQENLKLQDLLVTRTFWDTKARFNLAERLEWQEEDLLGQPGGRFTDAYVTSQLQIQHTPKLSSHYFYTFTNISQSGGTSLSGSEGSSNLSLIQIPAFTSSTLGGGVDYRIIPSVTLFQQVQEYFVTTVPGVGEAETSEFDSMTGAAFGRMWRGFELGGSYSGHFQELGTTLGHHPATFSNDLQGRVSWGDVRRVRLTASGIDSKYNLVEELGGFTTNRSLRLQAETTRLRGWHLQGSAERARLEYLSASGDVKTNTTNYSAQVEKGRVALGAGRQALAGAGALFPALVTAQQWLGLPLPLGELVATPLLNRLSHVNTAAATLRLRRQFDVSANYMSERDQLAASEPKFRTIDVSARYHIGKLGIQAGFGSYRIENITVPLRTGNLLNRYFLRISRDFKFF